MVEQTIDTDADPVPKQKPKSNARPKAVSLWSVADVLKWLTRHCGEFPQYAETFQQHEITGRALLRLTDDSLLRMGIVNNQDRDAIWREIVKQRLKTDIMEVRDMEFMTLYFEQHMKIPVGRKTNGHIDSIK